MGETVAKYNRIKITDLKSLAKSRDQQALVVIGVERDGTVTIVSYGETKNKCQAIGWWAKGLSNILSIAPFRTIFGWGNSGIPKSLDDTELVSLYYINKDKIPLEYM